MLLIGGSQKKNKKAAELSTQILGASNFSSIHFLYAFSKPNTGAEPIIEINDLLLENAKKEYSSIINNIRSNSSNLEFSCDFKNGLTSKLVLNFLKKNSRRLIVLGESETSELSNSSTINEINLFLKKTESSVLVVPEKSNGKYPEYVQVLTNSSSLVVLENFREFLPLKFDHMKINKIKTELHNIELEKNDKDLCTSVKSQYTEHFDKNSIDSESDMIILSVNDFQNVSPLVLESLYDLCIRKYNIPLLFFNSKLVSEKKF